MNARHSANTPRWGSPPLVVEWARQVMGWIALDPCSEAVFEPVVKAGRAYSLLDRGEDGAALPWYPDVYPSVFCNPPGGLVASFWHRAVDHVTHSGCAVFWVGFSIEQLATLHALGEPHPLDYSCCILRKRLPFRRHDGFTGSPSHANYVVGMGVSHVIFERVLKQHGKITKGVLGC